jgi:hypothetical protein
MLAPWLAVGDSRRCFVVTYSSYPGETKSPWKLNSSKFVKLSKCQLHCRYLVILFNEIKVSAGIVFRSSKILHLVKKGPPIKLDWLGEWHFRTFEDYEFRASFTNRKNTPTFADVVRGEKKLPFSCLKLDGSVRCSGQSLCPLYRPANLYLLLRLYYAGMLHSKRKNPARNSKSSNLWNRP